MGGIGEVRRRRFKMEQKRRQKGERLIIIKKRVESMSKEFPKGKRKYGIKDKSFSM